MVGLILAVSSPACGSVYGTQPSDAGDAVDAGADGGGPVDPGGRDAAAEADAPPGCTPVVAGPYSPSSADTSTAGGGTVDWSNVDSARLVDGASASVALAAPQLSRVLLVQDFRVALPQGSTVVGVSVEITRSAEQAGLRDAYVGIGLATGAQSASLADGTDWPKSATARNYGGPLETWGQPWTRSQVESSTFGVGVAVRSAAYSGSVTGRIDGVRLSVHYCR